MVNFQSEIEKAKACSADIAKLEQEKVQVEKLIVPVKALTGILESEEVLRRVPPVLVIQLLERLQLWFELRWSNVLVNVFQDYMSPELRLAPPSSYGSKMASLIEVTIEAIKRQLSQEEITGANSVKG